MIENPPLSRDDVYEEREELERYERRFEDLTGGHMSYGTVSVRYARRLGELMRLRDKGGEVTDETLPRFATSQTPGAETHLVQTTEGFNVAVEVAGPKEGYPLIAFHGLPGSRLAKKGADELLEEVNARVHRYDRPGFGLSRSLPGRLPVHSIKDVDAIAQHFGLKEYGLIADSGGGPHALACAALLPGVKRVAILGSPAPPEALGEAWFAGMHPSNVGIFRNAFSKEKGDRDAATYTLSDLWLQIRSNPEAHFNRELKDAPEYAARSAFSARNAVILHEGLHLYHQGWEDEVLAKQWGVDPRSIDKEAMVVYGGKDVFSPPQHGEWLVENIPRARLLYARSNTSRCYATWPESRYGVVGRRVSYGNRSSRLNQPRRFATFVGSG